MKNVNNIDEDMKTVSASFVYDYGVVDIPNFDNFYQFSGQRVAFYGLREQVPLVTGACLIRRNREKEHAIQFRDKESVVAWSEYFEGTGNCPFTFIKDHVIVPTLGKEILAPLGAYIIRGKFGDYRAEQKSTIETLYLTYTGD